MRKIIRAIYIILTTIIALTLVNVLVTPTYPALGNILSAYILLGELTWYNHK